jgi:hypothetical protein
MNNNQRKIVKVKFRGLEVEANLDLTYRRLGNFTIVNEPAGDWMTDDFYINLEKYLKNEGFFDL